MTPSPAPSAATPTHPGRRGRVKAVLLGLLVAAVGALAVGEWLGWPVLAGPLQNRLSAALGRPVRLLDASAALPDEASATATATATATAAGSAAATASASTTGSAAAAPASAASGTALAAAPTDVRMRFIGGLRLWVPQLEVAAPAWSPASHTLRALDLALALRYVDLWRAWRGQPLRIERLTARWLDARLERLADGRASWQFGPPPAPTATPAPPPLPSFGLLQVTRGHLQLADQPLALLADASWSLLDRPAPLGGSALQLDATGTYRQLPLKVSLAAAGRLSGAPAGSAGSAGGVSVGVAGGAASGAAGGAALPTDGAAASPALPVTLQATVGRAGMRFDGQVADVLHLQGLSGRFTLRGPSLAAVGDPVGVTLPTTAPFRAEGTLLRQGTDWRLLLDAASIGASQLNGAFLYQTGLAVPMLSGRLGGRRLALADLGPVVGAGPPVAAPTLVGPLAAAALTAAVAGPAAAAVVATAVAVAPAAVAAPGAPSSAQPPTKPATKPFTKPFTSPAAQASGKPATPPATPQSAAHASRAHAPGKVLPDRPFDLAALRAMDANVLIDIAEVDLNTTRLQPLRPLRTRLQLAGGVLTLHDLDARTAQGRLQGDLALDGRGKLALWTAKLRWDGVRLEQWIQQNRAAGTPPYVSGRLNGRTTLAGQGRSTAEILASLQGSLHTELRDGTVSHLAVEAAGLDVAQGLGVLLVGDDALPVSCAVGDLVVERGVFRPRVLVIDTPDSALWVEGSLSLATEALDLRLVVSPKDFSPLALRMPLRVRGTFGAPVLSLEPGRLAPKLAAAALLALINPLAALIPLIDPGDADAAKRGGAGCQSLTDRHAAREAGAATRRPAKRPAASGRARTAS